MNNSLDIMRLILATLFVGYEFWAFRNKRSLYRKLSPIILIVILSLVMLGVALFTGLGGYYFIFVILIIELSLIAVIIVGLIEGCLTLFGPNPNLKKGIILVIGSILLVVIYYLGEKVF